MGWQLASHDSHPQAVGGQPAAEASVEKLFIDEGPELIAELSVVGLAANEEQFEEYRLRSRTGP